MDFLPQGATVNVQYDLILGYFFPCLLMICYKVKLVSKLHLFTHIYLQISGHLKTRKGAAKSLTSEKNYVVMAHFITTLNCTYGYD